jgi:hypothetical protein
MNRIELIATAMVFAVVSVSNAIAQGPPPAASGPPMRTWTKPSLADQAKRPPFTSSDGRFVVALPKDISGFSAITPKETGVNISGATYLFTVKEGDISASFWDYVDPNFDVKADADYEGFFNSMRQIPISRMKATLVSERPVKVDSYRGYNFVYDLTDGRREILRVYFVNKRAYSLQGLTAKGVANAEQLITNAFDSFQLLSSAKIDADLEKSIEASTPVALPQTGKRKATSDAQDDRLKGKVKKVITEEQDLSGTWSIQTRHTNSAKEFDERGDLLKLVEYDSRGNPFQIEVYGYIDGDRASKSKEISYEYDPPAAVSTGGGGGPPSHKKWDPRYGYKYLYKYLNGIMVEKQSIMSNGDPWLRTAYEWKSNQLTESIYDENGKINQKYIYTYDENGNEMSEMRVGVINRDPDEKYSFKYESFDSAGNWTKRIKSKLVIENGKDVYKPDYVSWRTITYY